MPVELRVGPQIASVDRDATAALYTDGIKLAGADECGCSYCMNFALLRANIFPDGFLSLLKRLGANPLKELEVFELGPGLQNPEHLLYGGWFVLRGRIVEGADWRPEGPPGSFTYWLTSNFPNAGLAEDSFAIEFLCEVPWTISETKGRNS